MTHTPGPWQIGGELISQEGTNIEIASVWAQSANRKFAPSQSKADANARLIAAAPELFEALKVCQVRIFMLEGSENNEYQTATDAIAKATG